MKGLILTYLIAVFGTIGALRYPLIGLYVFAGFAVLRPQFIFGFAGDIAQISLVVAIALIIGWALKGFGSWRMGRARPVFVAFLVFVTWFVLSAFRAIDTVSSYGAVQALAKLVLPFLAGATLLKDEKDARPLLWTIVLAQGYVGFEMNLNYLFKGFNEAAEGFGGMDNNFFGASLVCVIGPALMLALTSKTWWSRCLATVAGVLILHTILLTFSRGAMLGLVAVVIAVVVIMPKRPKYIAAVLVVVLLAARLVGPQLASRYGTIFVEEEGRDASSETRLDLWRDCLKVIAAYPVFGVGPWNWSVVAESYGWPPGKSAHSVWMETAAEIGLPGAVSLIAFFGLAAVRLWPIARARQTDANRSESGIAAGVVLSIVGFVVAGQFVSAKDLEAPYFITLAGIPLLKNREVVAAQVNSLVAVARPGPSRPLPAQRGSVSRL
jgi:putative inorganic carbon (HCO3(-)) transporter